MKSHGKSKAVLTAVIFEVNLLQSSRFGDALLLEDGTPAGVVTSGSFAPSLGHVVAFAWADADKADAAAYLVQASRSQLKATVTEAPFYKEGTARQKLA